MELVKKRRLLIPAEVLIVSRCREWENGLRMVAMDEKDFGVICVVEREVHVLYAG